LSFNLRLRHSISVPSRLVKRDVKYFTATILLLKSHEHRPTSYLSVFLSANHLDKKRIESQWLQGPVLQDTYWHLVPGFYIYATFDHSLRCCTVTTVFLVSHDHGGLSPATE